MTQEQKASLERICGMLEGIAAVAEKAEYIDKQAVAEAIGDCVEQMDELITNDIWEHDEPRIEPAEEVTGDERMDTI